MQGLVDRLLQPYRRESHLTEVNLHEVLERVRNLVSVEFGPGLSVLRDYDVSVPAIMGDREQLIQVFLNLMRNAAEAGKALIAEGRAELMIKTRIARQCTIQRKRYRLAVNVHIIDNGPGIDRRIREKFSIRWSRDTTAVRDWGFPSCRPMWSGTEDRLRSTAGRAARISVCFPVGRTDQLNRNKKTKMRQIWVVDDDRSIRWVLEKALTRAQMPFRLFESAADVVKAFEHDTPSVLLSDIRMHDMSGLDLLAFVKNKYPGLPVIIMTAFSDLDSAVSAFQGGAYEYLAKPFDINSAIDLLRRAREESTVAESTDASDLDDKGEERRTEIIGQSRAMQEVFRAIGRLSHSHVTVLLTGESGTGKEVVARALHQHSLRSRAPFVAINTAAIPRELLESELFGHERGAFTGANQLQYGRFEQAKGGTLFLDEIGDMPADLQTRLLRVLSDGYFYRVGGTQSIKADVRVIAATNQNLEERVRQGLFREDLYHRLNVIHLQLPPLRERTEDIEALADHF